MRNDLVEVAQVFYRNNRPAIMLIPTNGLLTQTICEKTEEILKQCPKSTVVVKLSLDGPEELHDALRRVPGAFQRTLETYRGLKRLLGLYPNLDIGINSVFCAVNQDKIVELMDFVRSLDQRMTHTVSLVRGKVGDESLKQIDLDLYRETTEIMESNLRDRTSGIYRFGGARLKAAQDILQRKIIHKTMKHKKRFIPCYAGQLSLVLTETGDLYPCESFTRGMGNIRLWRYDIHSMLNAPSARQEIAHIQEGGCFCTHECNAMMNILFTPAMYPLLFAEYLKLVFGLPVRASQRCLAQPIAKTGS